MFDDVAINSFSTFVLCNYFAWLFSHSVIAQNDNEDEFVFPTAQQVIDKYIQALGGYEVLASRENIHYVSNGHSSHGSVYTYEVYQGRREIHLAFRL